MSKTIIPVSATEDQKEMLTIFSKEVLHASSLAGWLKMLAFREIDSASPQQREKLERLLGV
tara:strand:+ start:313 stop:495 length:183 start_codon:yes stop_codon:yes gene_type:complete